ncbi:ABC-three component system protein [Streptomyces sp. NPDC048527]|uniref:ABC-three component system protein n=1 Tax=Streptomyces sp. NPDC048527 TaxID=3365568 RepID=UPI0037138837
MTGMTFEQRMYAQVLFYRKLYELEENAFEIFFHGMMQTASTDYTPIRAYGNIGDRGADAMALCGGKLYACFGPRVPNIERLRRKFTKDLASALEQRPGEFGTFVFVHNDRIGLHPDLGTTLRNAQKAHTDLTFETMDPVGMWRVFRKLDLDDIEELLGCEIPVNDAVYGIGVDDLKPLLDHVNEHRRRDNETGPPPMPSQEKLEFSKLDEDNQEALVLGMKHSPLVRQYYEMRYFPLEEANTAQGFRDEYLEAKAEVSDPDLIIERLKWYVIGNRLANERQLRAMWVVLAYFFERCHIFENPPPDWVSSHREREPAR